MTGGTMGLFSNPEKREKRLELIAMDEQRDIQARQKAIDKIENRELLIAIAKNAKEGSTYKNGVRYNTPKHVALYKLLPSLTLREVQENGLLHDLTSLVWSSFFFTSPFRPERLLQIEDEALYVAMLEYFTSTEQRGFGSSNRNDIGDFKGFVASKSMLLQKITVPATRDGIAKRIAALERHKKLAVAWREQRSNGATYRSYQAPTLYWATEILRHIPTVPQNTYYVVDTPDGSLGRDIFGFYTEAPIKTSGIRLESDPGTTAQVSALSLTAFGDTIGDAMKSQASVAALKAAGQYASFVLQLECGDCLYKSPVETEEGFFKRQCYACGAPNEVQRGQILVMTHSGQVAI
jgi:hypothetical protein